MKLSSRAFLDPGEGEPPHVKLSQLEGARADGLIALTGGPDGPIDRALAEEQKELAAERLQALSAIFGDRLYVELQRHGLTHEIEAEPDLLALAYAQRLPIVATNEVYFASPDDYEAHDALLCIAEGSYVVEDNRRRLSREHYFKSAERWRGCSPTCPRRSPTPIEIAKRCAFRPARPQADPAAFVAGGAGG